MVLFDTRHLHFFRILIVLCEISALPIFGKPHTGKPLFVKFHCLFKVRILIVLCEISAPGNKGGAENSHKMHQNPYLEQATKFYKKAVFP